MSTVFIRFLQGMGLILVLLTMFISWLLGTRSGLVWMVGQLQPTIKIESIEGTLGAFQFNGLEASLDGVHINIDRGSLQWDLGKLWSKTIEVASLELDGVDIISLKKESANTGYSRWQGLDVPVDVTITNAQLNRLSFNDGGGPNLIVASIALKAAIENNFLQMNYLDVAYDGNSAQVSGEVDLSASSDGIVELENKFVWRVGETELQGQGDLSGYWESLLLTQSLTSLGNGQRGVVTSTTQSATLSATLTDVLGPVISWQATLETAGLGEQRVADTDILIGAGKFDLSGSFDPERGIEGLNLNMLGDIAGGNTDVSYWSLDTDINLVNGDIAVNTLKLVEQSDNQPASLTAQGRVARVSNFLSNSSDQGLIDLKGTWTDFRWPLVKDSQPSEEPSPIQIASASGDFTLIGSSKRYKIKSKAKGLANGKPMNANIELALGESISINRLVVGSGQSTLHITGVADQQLSLNWDLQSPDLGDFLQGAEGVLNSHGELTGERSKPNFKLTASSTSLQWSDYLGSDIRISAQGALSNLSEGLSADVEAASLDIGGSRILKNFKMGVVGSGEQHSVSVNSILDQDTQLEFKANGGLREIGKQLEWHGGIKELNMSDPRFGSWDLESDTHVRFSSNAISLSPSCLLNQVQSVCAQINSNSETENGKIDAKVELSELDLTAFNGLLFDYDLDLDGVANGELVYLRQSTNDSVKLSGFVESNSMTLNWLGSKGQDQDQNLDDESVTFDSMRIEINQQAQLDGSLSATVSSGDRFDVQLGVASAYGSAAFSSSPLKGSGELQIADLSILPSALLNAISLNGAFNSTLNLSGSINSPKIVATALLADAHAEIPELGLVLEGMNLDLSSDGSPRLKLLGQLTSGEGMLKIDGAMDFSNMREPVMSLSLTGDKLTLSDTPELLILGDVNLLAKFENNLFDLDGSVKLDQAELDFKVPESAVLASDDIILLGAETEKSIIEQRINLEIDLGEKTHIQAKGLDAKLAGTLRVFREELGILRGEGQININDGRYRAYQQDLEIDKGRLVFSGGSIEDPNLDLTAQKTVDDTTVGVSVTGRANAPKLNLYSNPSMPDQDILAVLLFNKRVGELGAGDALTLLRIANSLRGDGEVSEVAQLTDKLQQTLGLTSLEFQLSSDAPSIVAGKQFSSRFYVGYGYGLLDAAQSIILRYNLSDAWSIKADVGANSGADLLYRVER